MTLAPADYIYSNQTFGSFYYKFYGINNWISAKLTCEKDRAVLPVPRSDEENEFQKMDKTGLFGSVSMTY